MNDGLGRRMVSLMGSAWEFREFVTGRVFDY